MKPSLANLIQPFTLDQFMVESWIQSQPLVAHDLSETVRSLISIPALASLDSLLAVWPMSVQAHLPDLKDESSSISVPARDAKKLYQNQMSLLFNNVQNVLPELEEWLAQIKLELGLPQMTHARCMVYATPDGKGTAPHFDQNVNFVLQLKGTKTWWLAPNEHVENPTERHTMGQPVDPELASYTETEFPLLMPDDSAKVVLKPGSMLFVPRGFWHRTEASGEALALNFTFSQPSWADLFTAALKSRLMLSPQWRALADGASSRDPEIRADAEADLDELLTELASDIPNWQAADILGATEGF